MPRCTYCEPSAGRGAVRVGLSRRQFHLETLETRNRDRLDFHDVAVWALRAALEDAFEAGRRAGHANRNPERPVS